VCYFVLAQGGGTCYEAFVRRVERNSYLMNCLINCNYDVSTLQDCPSLIMGEKRISASEGHKFVILRDQEVIAPPDCVDSC